MSQKMDENVLSANVINIQRFSLQDGPGIRSTVFFKGCPLRCMWCSNPETQSPEPQLQYNRALCDFCKNCLDICTDHSVRLDKDQLIFDYEEKQDWGKYINACNRLALTMAGKKMTVDEILSEVLKDRAFYGEDGGVTFSGGEALMHPELLITLARKLKEEHIHLILDTSAYASEETVKKVVPYFDEIYVDVKHMDAEKHRYYTGVDNQIILSNLYTISDMNIPVAIRYPMIPGVNDSPDNLKAMAEYVNSLPQYTNLYVLPYHRYGITKYESLGMTYKLSDLKVPEKEKVTKVKYYLASQGVRVAGVFEKAL